MNNMSTRNTIVSIPPSIAQSISVSIPSMAQSISKDSSLERKADYESSILSTIGRRLYLDVDTADVFFVFNSGERIPAHKNHLIVVSDVFRTMFNGSWKEKDEVQIFDTSVAGFKEFLQFFYYPKVTLTMSNIGEVINLAKMYDITECLNVCWDFLKQNVTNNNVCELYDLAIFYEEEELKEMCKHQIDSNPDAVFKSAGFLGCHRRALQHILKLGNLSCRETEVFKAVMSWVKSASEQEQLTKDIIENHLGELFNQIRFRSMELDEFSDLLPSFGHLFTADEYSEILQMIRNPNFLPKIFNPSRRSPLTFVSNKSITFQGSQDSFEHIEKKRKRILTSTPL